MKHELHKQSKKNRNSTNRAKNRPNSTSKTLKLQQELYKPSKIAMVKTEQDVDLTEQARSKVQTKNAKNISKTL